MCIDHYFILKFVFHLIVLFSQRIKRVLQFQSTGTGSCQSCRKSAGKIDRIKKKGYTLIVMVELHPKK